MPRNPYAPESRIFNRIAVLRAERALSRTRLAAELGVNYQTVGYLERGEYAPSLDLAMRIAEYFELPIDAIFSRTAFAPMSDALRTPRTDDRASAE